MIRNGKENIFFSKMMKLILVRADVDVRIRRRRKRRRGRRRLRRPGPPLPPAARLAGARRHRPPPGALNAVQMLSMNTQEIDSLLKLYGPSDDENESIPSDNQRLRGKDMRIREGRGGGVSRKEKFPNSRLLCPARVP